MAAGRWFARARFKGEKYKLTVFVNDIQAKELLIEDDSRTQTFDVPVDLVGTDAIADQHLA